MPGKMSAPTIPQPPRLPDQNPGSFLEWAKYFAEWILRELGKRPASGTAVDSVLLVSPTGVVYSVKVTDAGVLVTEKIAE